MPRIRTIKPEFWTSEQIVECSTNARLLFVGMWNFCDDNGIHPAKIKRLKMQIFPGDSFTETEIREWVHELICAGLLIEYEAEGKSWWQVTGWHHQKIDRPNPKYPLPNSTSIRRTFVERSPPETETETETEGKGETSASADVCGEIGETPSPPLPQSDKTDFYFECVGKGPKSWILPRSKLNEYVESYPDLDVQAEIRKARQWIRDNPGRRKTAGTGMLRFLTSWLNRAQNSARGDYGGRGRKTGPVIGPGQSYDPNHRGKGEF